MAKKLDEATKKRLRTGRMLLAGKRLAEVAEKIGVARQTVYTWQGLLDEGGIDALRAVPPHGRPAKLDALQLEGVRQPSSTHQAMTTSLCGNCASLSNWLRISLASSSVRPAHT